MRKLARNIGTAAAVAAAPLIAAPPAWAAGEPAGGAPLGDVALATGGAIVLSVLLLAVGLAHRSGRIRVLERAGAWCERRWGLPGWASLPGEISSVALLVALLGMYWDISLHIGQGRDPGPLANPAHYLILAGLFGVFLAGFVSIVLPRERPGKSAVTIDRSWAAPVGGVLLFACAAFSLLGFPLDDAWHRLFGQDVTLWGPTHLMLFGGAAMTLIGRSVLLVEGARVARDARERIGAGLQGPGPGLVRFQRATLAGAFLIGLSTFQGEFDFGVPQFRFEFEPVLIAVAASVALVSARIWAGRGGALIAVGLFIAIRGFVSLLVGPVFGETLPHFPLYLAEATLVELVALRVSSERPLVFGAACGALIGTVGVAAEWGWSHVWMPLPWPSSMLPEAFALGLAAALAGGLVGALIGSALASDHVRLPRRGGLALAAAAVTIAAIVGYGLHTSPSPGESAHVTLTDVRGGAERSVSARVVLSPRDAADDAQWLSMTAWQGGGLVLDRLERVDRGVYRTTEPIPVHGNWKALLRLHHGDSLQAVPIYLPRDPAIPAREVPAPTSFTREFVPDKQILQREAKSSPGALSLLASSGVLAIALALLALMAWGLRRLALDGRAHSRTPPRSEIGKITIGGRLGKVVRPSAPTPAKSLH
jgi:uncharacterized protein YndB with AHSA1/START domain